VFIFAVMAVDGIGGRTEELEVVGRMLAEAWVVVSWEVKWVVVGHCGVADELWWSWSSVGRGLAVFMGRGELS
jgi:hypothetical protein